MTKRKVKVRKRYAIFEGAEQRSGFYPQTYTSKAKAVAVAKEGIRRFLIPYTVRELRRSEK